MKKNYNFLISRGVPENMYAKYYDTTLVMLERTMYHIVVSTVSISKSLIRW